MSKLGLWLIAGIIVAILVGLSIRNSFVAEPNSADTTITTNTNEQENTNMLQGTNLENFTPIPSEQVTELKIIDIKVGDGEVVPEGATVAAHYTGATTDDGKIFQSSHDFGTDPITFPLSGVIAGWTQGVPGMKVGGIRRLVIPAELAYGANPPSSSGIPSNAALVFDIEMVDVQ